SDLFCRCPYNVPASTVDSTLSLHDALPIFRRPSAMTQMNADNTARQVVITHPDMGIYLGNFIGLGFWSLLDSVGQNAAPTFDSEDRKSTRLNSSHVKISYAVFCLKKKIEIE